MVCDVHPLWLAQSRMRRRRHEECAELCSEALRANPLDQVAWYLKCRALTMRAWVDDTDLEEQSVADLLMDEHNTAQVARPGTSLARPRTGAEAGAGLSPAVRPMTSSGRPLTGFVGPGTGAGALRPGTGGSGGKPRSALTTALKGARPGTRGGRPVTNSGRALRLGTASLAAASAGGLGGACAPFILAERLDLSKYARRPQLARVLMDYLVHMDHNPRRALELAAHATAEAGFADWWWKERLAGAYYQLGLLREAEAQLASAARDQLPSTVLQDVPSVAHRLSKVKLRLDQPLAALELLASASLRHPADAGLLLGQARVLEALGRRGEALALWRRALELDAGCVEALACLAADHFYSDQQEVALRYYRRLLQMGVATAEVLTNLGLCCFHAGAYDLVMGCLERALALAGDDLMPDVWYNVGQVAVGIGDLSWAAQCFRLAAALNPEHAEALNNLGVLELRRGELQQAAARFRAGCRAADHVYEPRFNAALLAHRQGDLQEAFAQVSEALAIFPEHSDSLELMRQLRAQLNAL